jgi:hypothetical protein
MKCDGFTATYKSGVDDDEKWIIMNERDTNDGAMMTHDHLVTKSADTSWQHRIETCNE